MLKYGLFLLWFLSCASYGAVNDRLETVFRGLLNASMGELTKTVAVPGQLKETFANKVKHALLDQLIDCDMRLLQQYPLAVRHAYIKAAMRGNVTKIITDRFSVESTVHFMIEISRLSDNIETRTKHVAIALSLLEAWEQNPEECHPNTNVVVSY